MVVGLKGSQVWFLFNVSNPPHNSYSKSVKYYLNIILQVKMLGQYGGLFGTCSSTSDKGIK